MKKEKKQITVICIFLIIGCALGCFVAAEQINQLSDPEYVLFWKSNNMPVPKPLGYTKSMISFSLLFSGIPAGLIFYNSLSKKYLTPIAPKIIIGIITFPIYTCIGIIGSIPFVVYTGIRILKNSKKKQHTACDKQ